jgi:hypothetical protein
MLAALSLLPPQEARKNESDRIKYAVLFNTITSS